MHLTNYARPRSLLKSASLTLKRRCQRCGVLVPGEGECRRCKPATSERRRPVSEPEQDAMMSRVARYAFGDWSKDCPASTDVRTRAYSEPRARGSVRRMAVTTDAQIASRLLTRKRGEAQVEQKPVLLLPPIVDLSDQVASLRHAEQRTLDGSRPRRAVDIESTLEVIFDIAKIDRLTDLELKAVRKRRWPLILGLTAVLFVTIGSMALVFV
ncbi:MAG: hypothetical protein ACI9MR_000482 [Myxococcota bacterium]|jgi:hypothetical protein